MIDTNVYTKQFVWWPGLDSEGRVYRCCMIAWKASPNSVIHSNLLLALHIRNNYGDGSLEFKRKRLNAARQPFNVWTSLWEVRFFISSISPNFSMLALIPHSLTMNPRRFSDLTPKTNVSGLRKMLWFLMHRNRVHFVAWVHSTLFIFGVSIHETKCVMSRGCIN